MPEKSKSCFRNDAVAKVTGRAKYSADLKFHAMLHAVPVYSDYIHAKVEKIDIAGAEKSAGVVKVITAKDVTGQVCGGQIHKDQPFLVQDKIRCHGDVVALVVAETRQQAILAAQKVTVKAVELESILDPVKAMEKDSPLVHEAHGSNILNHHKIRRGNVEQAFAEAAHVIEQDFTTQFVEHAYIEPESVIAFHRHDGVTEIHGGVQHPFTARRYTANLLGVSLAEVEMVGVPLGGGFGGKDDTASTICARTALAAKLTGRPVKMVYAREWSIRESYKRHPYVAHYKMGVDNSGKIIAMECKIVADGGAYTMTTPYVTWRSTVQCCGPYQIPNVHSDIYGIYTNNVPAGAFRGFGAPQVNFMIEQLVEIAAEKVGISETEFRNHNMLQQDSVTITEQKLDDHVVSLPEVMENTLQVADYQNKLANCSYGEGEEELYGIGYAMSYRGMSLGAEGMDFCSAIINCQFDGSILLEVGIHENGQGSESAMILLLAEHLGVNRDRIKYRRPSTSTITDGGPTVASRGTLMGGGAVVNTVKTLKQIMASALAEKLQCKAEVVKFGDDKVYSDKVTLSWEEAMQALFLKSVYPYAFGSFQAPKVDWDEENGKGKAYFTWVYGCDAVEVSVNKKTGKIKILNYVTTHDVGKAINPTMVLGQYYGGIAQGIGYALYEDLGIADGKIANANFNRYYIPRASDVPEITGFIVENADPNSPSSAKGIGEPALELAAPALANALYRATGQRFYNLPMRIKK